MSSTKHQHFSLYTQLPSQKAAKKKGVGGGPKAKQSKVRFTLAAAAAASHDDDVLVGRIA